MSRTDRAAAGSTAGPAARTPQTGLRDGAFRLLHIADRGEWEAALRTGRYAGSTRGRTAAEEGFVHASTLEQLGGVLNRFYRDVPPAELVLLVVDPDRLAAAGARIRWERPPGADERFPHLYPSLPVSAVVAVHPLSGGPGGGFSWPDLAGDQVALTPPRDEHADPPGGSAKLADGRSDLPGYSA